jgi:hypothetical protein
MSIKVSALFPLASQQTVDMLESYKKILGKAAPMRTRHLDELHYSIRDLSRMLTGDRADLTNDYMGDPRSLNAYLRYFLPWNLYRLTRLLASLEIKLHDDSIIVDLGAGPLTFAQALWISRPDLRNKKLTIINVDRTPKVMKQGQALFNELAGKSPWKIVNVKGGITTKLREKADLLVSANMVNEIIMGLRTPLGLWAEKFCHQLGKMLAKNGRLLLIEPGVRHCGRAISVMRNEFLQNGWSVLAPCPHSGECPMPGEHGTPWCHFNFNTTHAPQWLQELSARCGLEKDNVSLTFLYAAQPHEEIPAKDENAFAVRAVSESFKVETGGYGQYACSEKGLTLLVAKGEARNLFPGGLLSMPEPETNERDEKSGALIVEIPVKSSFNEHKKPYHKKPSSTKTHADRSTKPERRVKDSAPEKDTRRADNKNRRRDTDSDNENSGWSTSRNEALRGGRRDSRNRGGKKKG